jgi:hypothetical protein
MPVDVRSSCVLLLLLAACGSGAGAPGLVTQDDNQSPDVIGMATGFEQQILAAGYPPPPPAALAQGPIEALGNATITVSSIEYVVTGQTIIRRGGVAVPFSSLKEGESAAVKGAPPVERDPVAQVIDVLLVRVPLPKLAILKGQVTVGSDSITVLGQTVRVDAHTLILRGGRTIVPLSKLQNGEAANVTGRPSADSSLLALNIYVAD